MMDDTQHKQKNIAIIIGAGPAGLTAAYELLEHTDITPIILERDDLVGGISRTVDYKGNKIDIGGHRFFSKSDRVMAWWDHIMPFPQTDDDVAREEFDPEKNDLVMLVRQRLSRIFYLRKFFDYPISLSMQTIKNLGLWRMIKIGVSYVYTRLFPIRPEKSLEDFFINRFGRELYKTFFKDYTEKLWGVPCKTIKADWGAQRIKGLSVREALVHAMKSFRNNKQDLAQKDVETSLINRFLYPKYGPGQMWERVRDIVLRRGGELYLHHEVNHLEFENGRIVRVSATDTTTGVTRTFTPEYVFSSMAVKDLITSLKNADPHIVNLAQKLCYRDFMTAGLLCKKLHVRDADGKDNPNQQQIKDTWIYIQEPDIKMGRIQFFNNWSPYLVNDAEHTTWIGLEYFVTEGDRYWNMSDEDFLAFATKELIAIGMVDADDVLDGVVIRMPKAYPSYIGEGYERFDEIRAYVDDIKNLFLVGRNGMHRYNNSDHSMLSAMTAVENIVTQRANKDNIWDVNVEKEYHEEKK